MNHSLELLYTLDRGTESQLILDDRRSEDVTRIAKRTRGILSLGTPFSGSFVAVSSSGDGERISISMESGDISSLSDKSTSAYEKTLAALHKIVVGIFKERDEDKGVADFDNSKGAIF